MGQGDITKVVRIDGDISNFVKSMNEAKKQMGSLFSEGSSINLTKTYDDVIKRVDILREKTSKPIDSKTTFKSLNSEASTAITRTQQLIASYSKVAAMTREQQFSFLPPGEQKKLTDAAGGLNGLAKAYENATVKSKELTEAQRAASKAEIDLLTARDRAAKLEQARSKVTEAANKKNKLDFDKKALKNLASANKGKDEDAKNSALSAAKGRFGEDFDSSKIEQQLAKVETELSLVQAQATAASNELRKLSQHEGDFSSEAIADLEKELKATQDAALELEEQEKKLSKSGIDAAMKKASEAAKQLGINISDIDFSDPAAGLQVLKSRIEQASDSIYDDFNNSLQSGVQNLNEAKNSAEKCAAEIKKTSEEFDASAAAAQRLESFKQSIASCVGLQGAAVAMGRALRDAIGTIKELDQVMTEMAVVTDLEIGDYWEQLPEHTERANELGVAIKDVYTAETLYYQQGLKTNEVIAMSSETLKMARIAGLDAEDATNKMTAALRGFNMELNETSAQKVSDVYSELAAITASDVNEISSAMTKTASIASSAGMEFETTAAFLSQIIETTRESAETAGTAMKTVIARFQELKKDPAEIGTVDGEVVDANKIETALRSVGVSLRDASGQFRDLDDVFLELASKWDTLDTNTQRYIATIAAGSRQQSRFIAMMSDYGRTQELVTAANNSAGASNKQFEKTVESLESKLNKLKNAWDTFTMSILDNKIVKVGVDLLTKLIETVNKLTSVFGDFQGLANLSLMVGSLLLVGGALKIIITSFKNGTNLVQGFTQEVGKIGKVAKEVGKRTAGLFDFRKDKPEKETPKTQEEKEKETEEAEAQKQQATTNNTASVDKNTDAIEELSKKLDEQKVEPSMNETKDEGETPQIEEAKDSNEATIGETANETDEVSIKADKTIVETEETDAEGEKKEEKEGTEQASEQETPINTDEEGKTKESAPGVEESKDIRADSQQEETATTEPTPLEDKQSEIIPSEKEIVVEEEIQQSSEAPIKTNNVDAEIVSPEEGASPLEPINETNLSTDTMPESPISASTIMVNGENVIVSSTNPIQEESAPLETGNPLEAGLATPINENQPSTSTPIPTTTTPSTPLNPTVSNTAIPPTSTDVPGTTPDVGISPLLQQLDASIQSNIVSLNNNTAKLGGSSTEGEASATDAATESPSNTAGAEEGSSNSTQQKTELLGANTEALEQNTEAQARNNTEGQKGAEIEQQGNKATQGSIQNQKQASKAKKDNIEAIKLKNKEEQQELLGIKKVTTAQSGEATSTIAVTKGKEELAEETRDVVSAQLREEKSGEKINETNTINALSSFVASEGKEELAEESGKVALAALAEEKGTKGITHEQQEQTATTIALLASKLGLSAGTLQQVIATSRLNDEEKEQALLAMLENKNNATTLGQRILLAASTWLQDKANKAETGSKTQSTLATWAQAIANLALQASFWPILVIGLLVIAAFITLAAVVLVLVAAIKAFIDNSPEGKLKAAEQGAESAAAAADEAAEAYQNLVDSLNELDDKYDALDELTEGTREWRNLLLEINTLVSDLIDKYPELARYVTTENGVMKIDTDSEEVQSVIEGYNKKSIQAANVQMAANISAAKARQEVDYTNLDREQLVMQSSARNNALKIVAKSMEHAGWLFTITTAGIAVVEGQAIAAGLEGWQDSMAREDTDKMAKALAQGAIKYTEDGWKIYDEEYLTNMGLSGDAALNMAHQLGSSSEEIERNVAELKKYGDTINKREAQEEALLQAMANNSLAMIDQTRFNEEQQKYMQTVASSDYAEKFPLARENEINEMSDKSFREDAEVKAIAVELYGEGATIQDDGTVKDKDGNVKATGEEFRRQVASYKATKDMAEKLELVPQAIEKAAQAIERESGEESAKAFKKLYSGKEGGELTQKDLKNLSNQDLQTAYNALSDEERKALGVESYADFEKYWTENAKIAQTAFDNAKKDIKTLGGELKLDDRASTEAAKGLGQQMIDILTASGQDVMQGVTNELAELTKGLSEDDYNAFMAQFNALDLSNLDDVERLPDIIESIGLAVDPEAMEHFIGTVKEAAHSVREINLEKLTEQITNLGEIAKNIRTGEQEKIFDSSDYETLIQKMPDLAKDFQQSLDGEYVYLGESMDKLRKEIVENTEALLEDTVKQLRGQRKAQSILEQMSNITASGVGEEFVMDITSNQDWSGEQRTVFLKEFLQIAKNNGFDVGTLGIEGLGNALTEEQINTIYENDPTKFNNWITELLSIFNNSNLDQELWDKEVNARSLELQGKFSLEENKAALANLNETEEWTDEERLQAEASYNAIKTQEALQKEVNEEIEKEYDYLFYYNQGIQAATRLREKAEREYEQAIENATDNMIQISAAFTKRIKVLEQEVGLHQIAYSKASSELDKGLMENEEFAKIVSIDKTTGTYSVDQEALKQLDDGEFTRFKEEFLPMVEDNLQTMTDAEDGIYDIEDEVKDIYKQSEDAASEMYDAIKEGMVAERQEEIDKLSDLNDSIKSAQDKIVNQIQTQINADRQARENEKREQELADKQSQLSYLMRDTSGANSLDILSLQDEIDTSTEEYQDTLVDQKLQEITDANAAAAEQRERQIEMMQNQLDVWAESKEIWQEVDAIIRDSIGANGDLSSDAIAYYTSFNNENSNPIKQGILSEEENLAKAQASYFFTGSAEEKVTGMQQLIEDFRRNVAGEGEGNNTIAGIIAAINNYDKNQNSGDGSSENQDMKREKLRQEAQNYINKNSQKNWTSAEAVQKDASNEGKKMQEKLQSYTDAGGDVGQLKWHDSDSAQEGKTDVSGYTSPGSTGGEETDIPERFRNGEIVPLPEITVSGFNPEKTGEFSVRYQGTDYKVDTPYSNWKLLNEEEVAYLEETSPPGVFYYNGQIYYRPPGSYGSYYPLQDRWWVWDKGQYTKLYEKITSNKMIGFATGGLADFTGPAWLDGTKSSPELVLNSTDTRNFIALKDILSDVMNGASSIKHQSDGESQGDNYYDIEINVDSISDDYDVEQLASKIKSMIYEDSTYRNVNAVNLIR